MSENEEVFEEEIEENDEPEEEKYDEDKERQKLMDALKEYLNSMEYKVPETIKSFSKRTDHLSKRPARFYGELYTEYKNVLIPKAKRKRIKIMAGMTVDKPMTMEELAGIMRNYERKIGDEIKRKEKSKHIYHDVLKKLENVCKKQLLNSLADKFIKYVGNRVSNYVAPPVLTQISQRLTHGLVCNMYLSLDIKQPLSKYDQNLFETIGLVLSDLILKSLFATQHLSQIPATVPPLEKTIYEKCIKPKKKKNHVNCGKTNKEGKNPLHQVELNERKNKKEKLKPSKLSKEFQQFLYLSRKKNVIN